jgi:hypothetical protein
MPTNRAVVGRNERKALLNNSLEQATLVTAHSARALLPVWGTQQEKGDGRLANSFVRALAVDAWPLRPFQKPIFQLAHAGLLGSMHIQPLDRRRGIAGGDRSDIQEN